MIINKNNEIIYDFIWAYLMSVNYPTVFFNNTEIDNNNKLKINCLESLKLLCIDKNNVNRSFVNGIIEEYVNLIPPNVSLDQIRRIFVNKEKKRFITEFDIVYLGLVIHQGRFIAFGNGSILIKYCENGMYFLTKNKSFQDFYIEEVKKTDTVFEQFPVNYKEDQILLTNINPFAISGMLRQKWELVISNDLNETQKLLNVS